MKLVSAMKWGLSLNRETGFNHELRIVVETRMDVEELRIDNKLQVDDS